ncbi:MAG: hypothetical protein ACT4O3_00825 [Elusimicrobiota bacterium]
MKCKKTSRQTLRRTGPFPRAGWRRLLAVGVFWGLGTALCVSGAASAQAPAANGSPAAADPAAAAPVSPPPPVYVYQGDRFRDPFIALAGQGFVEMAATPTEEGEFDPNAVELKGIIRGPGGRMALLRTPGGAPFIVKEGKIFNTKKKAVQGYVGIVKEKSLVMIGPNNKLTELSLKPKDEEGKSKP